jgi:peptidoglycan/LPS O-acetylase OafA/YrhL
MPRPRPASSLSGHLPALDGLRGLAILLVLTEHFVRLQPTTLVERLVSRGAAVGWVGVDLFFALSGFLITGILLEAKGGERFFRNFYMRRAFRIFPLYYGYLLLVFFGLPHLGVLPASETRDLLHTQGWYWSYLSNVLIARAGSWAATPLETLHFWSLAVEEQFYLVWPLVVWLLPRRRLKTVCLGALLGSLAIRMTLRALGEPGAVLYVLTPTHLDPLAAGAWLALVAREPGGLEWVKVRVGPALALGLAGIAAIMVTAHGPVVDAPAMQSVGYPLLALTCAALLGGALTGPVGSPLGRLWRSKALGFFGRLSYGLYVLHPLLLVLVVGWGFDVPWFAERAGSQLLGQAVFAGLMTALAMGVALLSWHAWEQPFLRLKSRFPMRGPRKDGKDGKGGKVRGAVIPRSASDEGSWPLSPTVAAEFRSGREDPSLRSG